MITEIEDLKTDYISLLKEHKPLIVCLLFLLVSVLIYFVHQFEVLLLLGVFFLYLTGLSINRILSDCPVSSADPALPLLTFVYRLGLSALIVASCWVFKAKYDHHLEADRVIVMVFTIILFVLLLCADFLGKRNKGYAKTLLVLIVGAVAASLDYQHIASLFAPELALPNGPSHERPVVSTGWFGGKLALPGWHLQLRSGLLWSGVVGALLAFSFALKASSKAWIFVASNCAFVWILCTSPYLYQWFSSALNYHSVWRFGILSFHPLILAAAFVFLFDKFRSRALLMGLGSRH